MSSGLHRKVITAGSTLTLSMIVHNEASRYLTRVLEHARQYIDAAVIIDDASTDNTVDICEDILGDIPLKIVRRQESSFATEYRLRMQQWSETAATKPDWIMVLDADEIFEDSIVTEIPWMMRQTQLDLFRFRLFDFWDEEHYRDDRYWVAHRRHRPYIIRYNPYFAYRWRQTPQHCGRLPSNLSQFDICDSNLRIKHYGWARSEDRELKFRRYMELDPGGRFGRLKQYMSILDENPHLVKWEE